jgi:hypothetical protein
MRGRYALAADAGCAVEPMSKTVAVVQSNYIPWKGYFDLIRAADEFILYDDMQYTRRDWRNRNKIKTPHGTEWLTIPVQVKGKYHQAIKDTLVGDPGWRGQHWQSLLHNYGRAPHFRRYRDEVEALYLGSDEPVLSRINHRFLMALCGWLGIATKITWSMDYRLVEGKSERLLDLCRQAGATTYLSGPAAKGYLDEGVFEAAGIQVRWMDYGGYPEYPQLFPPFDHYVSVFDLLFNAGPDAPAYLKRW